MYNQVVLFVGVITELFIWVVTLLTGIMFIASGLSNEEVIRSCVCMYVCIYLCIYLSIYLSMYM